MVSLSVSFLIAGIMPFGSMNLVAADMAVTVMSYNLYWWCVSDEYGNCPQFANGQGFSQLYSRIKLQGDLDLIGFQECDNVAQVLEGSGLSGKFSYYNDPVDAPLAWNSAKFTQIGSPISTVIGGDQYGDRYINMVRLSMVGTSTTVLFANTHGPLNHCDGDDGAAVANAYINAMNAAKQANDKVIFTGDFNCVSTQNTIMIVSQYLSNDVTGRSYGGADHILSNNVAVDSSAVVNGAPSDHNLVKAIYSLPGASPSPSPSPEPVPSGCPESGGNNGNCCLSCEYNHYCPSNQGCYKDGQAGCSGGYCPAPAVVKVAQNKSVLV
jgi:hypothetical protein